MPSPVRHRPSCECSNPWHQRVAEKPRDAQDARNVAIGTVDPTTAVLITICLIPVSLLDNIRRPLVIWAWVPKLHSHLAVLAPLFPKASAPERIGIYETSMRSESPIRSQRVKRHIDGTRFSSPECR